MPLVVTYGIPRSLNPFVRQEIGAAISNTMYALHEHDLPMNQIATRFVLDEDGFGETIALHVFVMGLFDTDKRTPDFKMTLCRELCSSIRYVVDVKCEGFIRKPVTVEVFTQTHVQAHEGFAADPK